MTVCHQCLDQIIGKPSYHNNQTLCAKCQSGKWRKRPKKQYDDDGLRKYTMEDLKRKWEKKF